VDDNSPAVPASKFFRCGVLLAWIPILVISLPGLIEIAGSVSAGKTTGLGAVAGGFSQAFFTFGFLAFVAAQVCAVTFLVRSFAASGVSRRLFSALTIGVSLLSLIQCGIAIWLFYYFLPRHH
jgi:hypothetical protein